MIEVLERGRFLNNTVNIDEVLILDHLQRKKGRQKVTAQSGHVIALFLERGKTLLIGEVLRSVCGRCIRIDGAKESVVTASSLENRLLTRSAYHLGNRHAIVQLGDGWLRFKYDHVLEALMQRFGLSTCRESVVFEPEEGAYSSAPAHSHEC
ncbi:MAG: urease accessory protein UreE [Spongiibacteraceae bacterium]|nr:urease accessory protein UreE [Spongiibacteraceae bacterium]